MSTQPNDLFNDSPTDSYPAAPKKSRSGCLIGCGVASVLMLLVCCGGGYWLFQFVSGEMSRELERRLAGNPVMQEHIGELESVRLDFMETSQQSQQAQQEGKRGVLVFTVEGSKGNGQLHVNQDESNQPDFSTATLVLPDGTRLPVDASVESDDIDLDGLEMDIEDLIDSGQLELDAQAPEALESSDTSPSPDADSETETDSESQAPLEEAAGVGAGTN
jgi:hypothetical protein